MLLFFPLFILELLISIRVGISIGFINSVLWIFSSMFLGIILLKESYKALFMSMDSLFKGGISIKAFGDASISYLAGSVLLIIPGVLSDLFGVILLFYTIYLHFIAKITPETKNNIFNKESDDVIDVEVINSNTDSLSKS